MKQKEVFNKIGVIIKEINDQYQYLETNPDDLNSLELELFVANAHFLADHAEILNKINSQASVARTVAKNEESSRKEKYFEPVVRQPDAPVADEPAPTIDLSTQTPKDSYSFIMEEPEIIRHELNVESIPDIDEEETEEPEEIEAVEEGETEDIKEEVIADIDEEEILPVEPEAPAEPVKAEKPEPAEKKIEKDIREEKLTINQKISSQLAVGKAGITEQAGAQPINDLKQAINLNDKMLYVKELFNGYSLAYSEAIEILNRFKNFEEADRFLNKNYVAKNNWESKPETTAKFYAILKRRYL
jgi:hypothetical protein